MATGQHKIREEPTFLVRSAQEYFLHLICAAFALPVAPQEEVMIGPVRMDSFTTLSRLRRWVAPFAIIPVFGAACVDVPTQPLVELPVAVTLQRAITSGAQTIYSNLGPGDSWSNTNGWSGPSLCTPTDCPGSPGALSRALNFVAQGDFLLTDIELAISDIGDPFDQRPGQTVFDIGIYNNSTASGLDRPDELLGSASTTAPENRNCNPATNPVCLPFFLTPLESLTTVTFTTPIPVTSGQRYWIGVHPGNPTDKIDAAWWWNHQEDAVQSLQWSSGSNVIDFSVVQVGGEWQHSALRTESAFRVSGLPSNAAPTAVAGPSQTVIQGLLATLDGSSSSDPDGVIASFDWDFGDGTNASGGIVEHVYAAPGRFTVTLTVTDDGGLTGSDATTVTVLSTADAIDDAIFTVAHFEFVSGIDNALSATLAAALASAETEGPSTVMQLEAFINQVEALRGKRITEAEADELVAIARAIIAAIQASQ